MRRRVGRPRHNQGAAVLAGLLVAANFVGSAHPTSLESLAAMTGGQSLGPEQLPELVKRLTQETQHLEVQQETKKTFWDTWTFSLTLVALLAMEWYLRKRWGIV